MQAIEEYHKKTPIRFKEYNPGIDEDYVIITGQNIGCFSHVGRQGGVSNTSQGVVKKNSAP